MVAVSSEELKAKRARLTELVTKGHQPTLTRGVNHVAIEVWDLERSLSFYCNLLGFPLLSVAANRDEPLSTHANVAIGEGVALSLFDFPHLDRVATEGAGGVMHIAIATEATQVEKTRLRLEEAGIPFQLIGGGLYFKDPDGLTLELWPIQE